MSYNIVILSYTHIRYIENKLNILTDNVDKCGFFFFSAKIEVLALSGIFP